MRRLLVTGGLGFIGSYAAEEFARQGWHVEILDDRRGNVISGRPAGVAAVHTASCEDRAVLARLLLAGPKPDLVLHCASPVGPGAIAEASYGITEAIVEPTIAVSRACSLREIPLIHISTSEVYGSDGICREDGSCSVPAGDAPRLEYAVGKIAAEKIASHANAAIIRPFNVTGARQDARKGFVVPNFVEAALRGEPLRVFRPGTQRRAIMAVSDLVAAFVAVSERKRAFGQTLNIGAPENETTIADLAERVVRLLDSRSEIEITDGAAVWGPKWTEAAGFHKLPDITKATSRLGWTPRVGLDETILALAEEIRPTLAGRSAA